MENRFAEKRRRYLREYRDGIYTGMLLTGKLDEHLKKIGDTAQEMFDKWVGMEEFLLVKFLDGNVKAQNPDGSWVTNGHSDKIPDKIGWPGYTDVWKRAVARDHGSVVEAK